MTEFPIERRDLLRAAGAGLVALGFTGGSSGGSGVSAVTAPENGDTGKHLAVGAETSEVWSQQQTLTANGGGESDRFGSSISVSTDLNRVFIGAPGDGAAYVFNKSGGTWSQQQKLTANGGDESDRLGSSISVSTDLNRVFIGAPGDEVVYVFGLVVQDPGGSFWAETQKLTASDGDDGDYFGESVAVSDSDGTAFIGAPGDNGEFQPPGAVYVYTEDGFTWSQQQKLTANNIISFGESVAASADGTTALVGSYGGRGAADGVYDGTAYVFTEDGGTWNKTQKLSPDIFDDSVNQLPFGDSIAVSADGTTALIGSADLPFMSGNSIYGDEVYVFRKDGGTWNQNQTLTSSNDVSESIESIAVSADGATALIASQRHESTQNGKHERVVYVFTKSGETWSQQQTLTPNDGNNPDVFGESVVISDDGATALIGAPGDRYTQESENAGSAYVFTENGSTPPGGDGKLDLSVQAGTAPPGGTYTLTYQITNTGSTTIGDGNDNSPAVTPGQGFPGVVTNEGGIPDGGAVDGTGWYAWTIDPGETLEANLEVELPDDIAPGEYEFTAVATQDRLDRDREYDRASGTVTVEDAGDISLTLAIADTTAEAGGTATVTYILTNEGNAESSGLQGRIDFPPGNWQLGDSGSFTSLGPGESDSVSAEVLVPESASGEYTIDGSVTDDAGNKATASGTVTVEPIGEPSWTLTAQAFQPVDGPGPLPAQPGETFQIFPVLTNTGNVSQGASVDLFRPSAEFGIESHTDDGGEWIPKYTITGPDVYGWQWDEETASGPIAPDETREPVVELAVAEDVSAGEYTFEMSGPDGAMATATVTVAPLDGTRQQKLALAGRIDDAATFDSLLTREPSTLAFQPEQEVARHSLDLLEESVPDGSLSRETAIDAANRLIWGEQLTEDVLQYTGDATITTDVTELPDDLNIAQQTAGPLLKVVVSLLLQTQAASKIVSSVSQKLPGAVSIDPSQIEGVAKKLLDIALGFNSETDDVPADAPDTTDPTTLLEDLQPEVATIVEEIENGVTTSVDAVLSTIDTVVQPFIDLAAGTLRVFLEHIALSGAVTEGIDAGLSGAVTNLHSALRPESIASGGLAGSQSQAEEAYIEGGAGLIQTAIESADVLDGFGTQEKLRDSTELAVNVLKLEPEEIDITTIVEFAIGQIREIPYGEALDLGLGIGFMLNLHASHSNAHTGIINGE